MGRYILAHDLGTSGNKATLYTETGEQAASTIIAYRTITDRFGQVEQVPDDWWNAVCEGTRQVMTDRSADDIAGISFSGQMMGCVCLDKDGELLMNSMIWADTRAANEATLLEEKLGLQKICTISGMRPAPNYTIEKLMWLKSNRPDLFDKTSVVLQAKDYIIYKMTGRCVTEPTDASATQAYDIRKGEWSDEVLQAANVSKSIMPELVPSTSVVGVLSMTAAQKMGLNAGTPVVAGGGDGLCAAVGAGSIIPGKGYCCLGSSSWISCSTDQTVDNRDGNIMYSPHVIAGRNVLAGTMQTGMLSYTWAKEKLYPLTSFDDMNAAVREVPPGSNGVMFMPYLMGERAPWWNASVRGSFLGLGIDTTAADMMHAVIEGVALNLSLIFSEIEKYERIQDLNLIGGGAKAKVWQQTLADVLGVPVYKLANSDEGSSFGAAIVAGVALGIYASYEEALAFIKREEETLPNMERNFIYRDMQERFIEAYHATNKLQRM